MVWSENFHFKPFPDSRAKRDRELTQITPRTQIAIRLQLRIAPRSHPSTLPVNLEARIARLWLRRWTQRPGSHAFDFADFARLRLCRDGTETAPIALRSQLRNCWVLMNLTGFDEFFLVGFCFCVYLLRNDIIYLFGSWENVRKCEEQEENVFSILFSTTQPNTRKYFPKHFLECNQTLENIFLSQK